MPSTKTAKMIIRTAAVFAQMTESATCLGIGVTPEDGSITIADIDRQAVHWINSIGTNKVRTIGTAHNHHSKDGKTMDRNMTGHGGEPRTDNHPSLKRMNF